MPGDQTRKYRIQYSVEDRASAPIGKLTEALLAADRARDRMVAGLLKVGPGADAAGDSLASVWQILTQVNEAAGATGPRMAEVNRALGRVDFNAGTAAKSFGDLRGAIAAASGQAAGVDALQQSIQRAQRSAYGLKMNAADAAKSVGMLGKAPPGVDALAGSVKGLGDNLKTTNTAGGNLQGTFVGLGTAYVGLELARDAARALGSAFNDAREWAKETAGESLKIRDSLREIANLSGKPGADDGVVAEHLRLRVESGMTAAEARGFTEQFKGSLPLAKDAGGIDDKTAEALSRSTARSAVRVGLDGGTAGDLAGVLGLYGKVPDAQVGQGRVQQVVDLLNDGRGNLTPLTRALLKGASASVGPGKAFGSLGERAAAISVASGIGDKGGTDTTVGAAIRALAPGGSKGKTETLERLGIGGNQSFLERLERLAPIFDDAKELGKSPNDALTDAGFGNLVDRRALIGFFENRETLRKRIESVRELPGSDDKARAAGVRSEELNRRFFAGDKAARSRVADARLDASRIERGRVDENLTIARKEAEAALNREGQINTPGANFEEAAGDLFGLLPALGFPSTRQATIDRRIRRDAGLRGFDASGIVTFGATDEAKTRAAADALAAGGADPGKVAVGPVALPGAGPAKGEALPEVGAAAGKGGPAGPGGQGAFEAKLQQVVDLLKRANDQRDQQGRSALPLGGPNVEPGR